MNIFKDVRAAAVTAVGVALALSVVLGWNWPVLGANVRLGIVALGLVSLFACSSSGWATGSIQRWDRDPLLIAAALIGMVTLLIGALGLLVGTQPYLLWMLAGTVLLWLISTVRHALAAVSTSTRRQAAL